MNTKRQINGQKFSVAELVDEAIATATISRFDTEKARKSLEYLGNRNPSDEMIAAYARETAILRKLSEMTQANFSGQIGKISFDNRDLTITDVESYLNRRVQGQHARWTASH
jgi:hypothetical protein